MTYEAIRRVLRDGRCAGILSAPGGNRRQFRDGGRDESGRRVGHSERGRQVDLSVGGLLARREVGTLRLAVLVVVLEHVVHEVRRERDKVGEEQAEREHGRDGQTRVG